MNGAVFVKSCLLEARNIVHQVGHNVVDLPTPFDLAYGEAAGIGSVDPLDAGHVDPDLTFAEAGDDDGTLVGDLRDPSQSAP